MLGKMVMNLMPEYLCDVIGVCAASMVPVGGRHHRGPRQRGQGRSRVKVRPCRH